MVQLNQTYIHYKNKESYITINFCKIQENDIWVKAVIYKPADCDELFVREYKEFEEKFNLKN
ncbi:DUF1653 domain-containing protein [Poseidonibacter lekithochrous]|uniref:DUF1653 domain-containing protein n=1 Tax=Poseidonibacter TaxID=2321187 RepID=UPI001C092207|nr:MULTISPECIES: DUF1653 domain-containing protein [Poseidonibacter]MBU3014452.1 DUF1653 domain-containing protein [Poseidonibacter lekithochrous]MDO6827750.1 DUF1653 domain-containing protein [Poseidonibacter sp. 1_MG-2023]